MLGHHFWASDNGFKALLLRLDIMMSDFVSINLEAGPPTVDEARQRLLDALNAPRSPQIKLAIVIHGYGSTGVGGKIRVGIRGTLARMRNQKKVKFVIWGENFSMFDVTAQQAIAHCRSLTRSPYFERGNEGITVVVL